MPRAGSSRGPGLQAFSYGSACPDRSAAGRRSRESAAPRIRVGAPVRIRVQSLGSSLDGRVARVTKTVELDTRTMTAEIEVLNQGDQLSPGFTPRLC